MTARRSRLLGSLPCVAAAACMLTLGTVPALTQSARGPATSPPTPFQGLQQNNKEPIRIESASLEVRDKERTATFIDNVKVVQGDTTLECNRLIVYYDEEPSPTAAKGRQGTKSMLPSEGGQQQIRRLEAKGGVVVTQKDQVATGDNGVYEMKTNSIVLTGNVIVTRGQDVVKGHRLHVNMTTGHYRIDSAPAGGQSGPVRALINPGARDAPIIGPGAPSAKPGAPAAAPAASPLPPPPTGGRAPAAATERATGAAERDAAKQGPSRPLKLN
jgi:lipopolysaccharide export system protein LptA